MNFITEATVKAVKHLYNTDISATDINLQVSCWVFVGLVTIVTFPYTRFSKKSPEQTGTDIGTFLLNELADVSGFYVIKGFLNISLSDSYWINRLSAEISSEKFAVIGPNGKKVMVEYSSPNTNKPLHLGHVRNNLLGYSIASILQAAGYEVIKANLVNDRGIHICKSMLAWLKYGNGETPESSGMKGDHLVGKYYVVFEQALRDETEPVLNDIFERKEGVNEQFEADKWNKIDKVLQQIDKLTSTLDASEPEDNKRNKEISKKIKDVRDEVKEVVRNQSALM